MFRLTIWQLHGISNTILGVTKMSSPGKAARKGISLIDLMNLFPNEEKARLWFESIIWRKGVECPHCGSDEVSEKKDHKPQPYRCRRCRKHFSVRTNTVMAESRLPLQKWAMAIYIVCTDIKGTSSLHLHRLLDVRQATAWYLLHRIREAFPINFETFEGPVEVDETYLGGKRKNMHYDKKKELTGRGAVGKTAIVGVLDRNTNKIVAKMVLKTDQRTLKKFVQENVETGAVVNTDEAKAYSNLKESYEHATVNHSVREFVNGQAHTNAIESFWNVLKKGYHGTFHHFSQKHSQRYLNEFAGRHNSRCGEMALDTIDMMTELVAGMLGKRLSYVELVGERSNEKQT